MRLAVLFFNEHARRCANRIYAGAMRQTHPFRGDGDRRWFVEADIPYRWDKEPFEMRVRALQLRPLRPSAPEGQRFLITSIDATSWPFPDQEIFSELANSNALSPDRNPKKVHEQYFRNKAKPGYADPDAELDHHSDAYKNAPDNRVDADDFRFLNEPKHDEQKKSTHKEYRGSSHQPEEGPSQLLSAGNTAPGEEKPAPLVAESRDRRLAPQLQLLLNGLDDLVDAGDIEDFHVLNPPESSHLRRMRNGHACWSFVSEDQMRALRAGRAVSGWEFIFEPARVEGGPRRATPRCVLVVSVQLDGRTLILFEIEPRISERAYRFYIVEPSETTDWAAIETALIVLRAHNGRLSSNGKQEAFRSLTSHPALAAKHRYIRDEQQGIVALDIESLLRAMKRALGHQECSEAWNVDE